MAVVGPDEVRHIAQLARLELAEDRLALVSDELSAILAHMEAIASFEVSAESRDTGPSPRRRSDETTAEEAESAHLIQAPTEGTEVRIPQVKDAS